MNKFNESSDFPDNYPEMLKPISWRTVNIAGPHKYWNHHLSSRFHDSKYFVKPAVQNIFTEQKIPLTSEINELINYFLKCFTIYYIDDEFRITMKKDNNKKVIFSDMQWKSLCNECGINGRKAVDLLKHLIRAIYKFYNDLLKFPQQF